MKNLINHFLLLMVLCNNNGIYPRHSTHPAPVRTLKARRSYRTYWRYFMAMVGPIQHILEPLSAIAFIVI